MKYQETIQHIEKGIGGISNIASADHCATRLRFTIKDPSLIDSAEIEKGSAVIGVRLVGENQLQIICGTDVVNVYNDFLHLTNFKGDQDNDNLKQHFSWKNLGSSIVEYISGTVAPVIPIYLCAGMLLAFLTICTNFFHLDANSGTAKIINAAASASFYFMPIVLGWSADKKLDADPALGAMLGMTLVFQDINNVGGLSFLGIHVPKVQYSGSFLPMLLGSAFLALVYRFLKNRIPQSVRYFLLPLITMLITIPVTLIFLGPIGYFAGKYLMSFLTMVAQHFKLLAITIWGFCTPLSIITGMDKAIYFINMEHLKAVGFDNIFLPGGLAGNASIAGAALAVWFMSKNKKIKQVGVTSGITALIGITEPALYGVCVNFVTPLIGAMTGAACGSLFAGIVNLKQYVYAGPGLATSAVYISPNGDLTNFYLCLTTIALSAIFGFLATYLFSLKNKRQYDQPAGSTEQISTNSSQQASESDSKHQVISNTPIEIHQLCSGKLLPLSEVKDDVFSQKMMGDGYAVQPTNDKYITIDSPVKGRVEMIAKTKHAIGIKTPEGLEVMLHLGLDTVELAGKPFQLLVKKNQKIAIDTPLVTVDLQSIRDANKDDQMIVVFTNMNMIKHYRPIITKFDQQGKINQKIGTVSLK